MMTNSIKYLFLLILCLGLTAGLTNVSAQNGNDPVLVAAGKKPLKQSDINTLIEFYEWAFEAKFSAAQRRKYQEYTVEEFRSSPSEVRQTIDEMIVTLPKILASDADVQQKTRETFLGTFLPELRKNSDANSEMLVQIYEATRRGNDGESDVADSNSENSNYPVETGGSNNNNDSSDANVGNISALAGKWAWGRSGSSTYTTGGAYMGSNGSRFTYQFSPNGAVEYTGIMNMMTGGCKMQVFRTMRGKASLKGDTLTINWSPASFSRDDSCSPSKNYKKTMPAETETFKVAFKDSYGQKQLCLTGKDETCFSPEN
ncbi:MAG TPA: hypothetical protein VF599_14280 [Pyrinomonadaceae bacterium]|jgi:hypothetical protein